MTREEQEDQERIDSMLRSFFKEVRKDEFIEQMRLVQQEMERHEDA